MAEEKLNITMTDLQKLMESVVTKMKEPTETEKAKAAKEHTETLKRIKEQEDLAKANEQAKENKRRGCPHYHIYNGRQFNKWIGQVHNDGLVHPVCNMCHTEWPPFSAKLLPDEGKQGVNMEAANPSTEQLSQLHRTTFPRGCDRPECWICFAKKKAS